MNINTRIESQELINELETRHKDSWEHPYERRALRLLKQILKQDEELEKCKKR